MCRRSFRFLVCVGYSKYTPHPLRGPWPRAPFGMSGSALLATLRKERNLRYNLHILCNRVVKMIRLKYLRAISWCCARPPQRSQQLPSKLFLLKLHYRCPTVCCCGKHKLWAKGPGIRKNTSTGKQ